MTYLSGHLSVGFMQPGPGRQREEDNKRFVRDRRDRAIICGFCQDLELTWLRCCLTKRSFARKVKFGGRLFKHKFCHAVTKGLPSSFPRPPFT